MNRNELINAVIDDGIEEIRHLYTRPDQRLKKEGGINGFEECRGKSNDELVALLTTARMATSKARLREDPNYWGVVMYERQIEWVLNVLSAAMLNQGDKPLIPPTVRGFNKAGNILGFVSA
jgi:hypothetical protein